MKIIGWHLVRLAAEAQARLAGSTVESIHRHERLDRVLFVLRSSGGKQYLVAGVRTPTAILCWSGRHGDLFDIEHFAKTESFNRLRGAHLVDVSVPNTDRLLRTVWQSGKTDEEGEPRRLELVFGWMGAAGNIWLLESDDQTVLESWHEPTERPGTSDRATGARGSRFAPPEPPRLGDWRTMTPDQYRSLREENPPAPLVQFLQRRLWGIDGRLAATISGHFEVRLAAAGQPIGDQTWSMEFEALRDSMHLAVKIDTDVWLPSDTANPEQIRLVSAAEAPPEDAVIGSLASVMAVLDTRLCQQDSIQTEWRRLQQIVDRKDRELRDRQAGLERAIAQGDKATTWQKQADILGANRHRLERGLVQVTLPPEESGIGREVTIPLDPARSPQQNIEALYRRARKAAKSAADARARLPHIEAERDRLRATQSNLESTTPTVGLVQQIQDQLGLDKPQEATRAKRSVPRRLPYREFMVGDWRVWVGRSSRDNDELTLHHAAPQDLFLHAQGAPGSHVILKRADGKAEFDQQTVVRAAQIAAFFSRARPSGVVPVIYAEVRYVRKPHKAPPGTVRVERERSILVQPSPPPGYHETREPPQ
ncbi:MAG: DUF814 domain-containing protein [candidate division Zixibacteria bacterium]|nr:DUF814 domain-containing protein [candidate division Zixibacteria bacterium]